MTTAMTTTLTSQPSPCQVQPPQNMSCGLSSTTGSARSSRPKLTLQTASVPRTCGKSNTALSLPCATDPTASPTVRNTFKNAFDVPLPSALPSSPIKATPPPPQPPAANKPSKPALRYAHNAAATATNNNNNNISKPYQLPLGVKSILVNSPLEVSARQRSNGGNGVSGAPRRVLFPAKKQVSYRFPLEEEIRTVRFTARHSDLDDDDPDFKPHGDSSSSTTTSTTAATTTNDESASDDDSDSSSNQSHSDNSSSTSDEDSAEGTVEEGSSSKVERKKRKLLGTERQIRAVALMDGLDGDGDAYGPSSMTPQSPHCPTKRRREWKWTLGPLRPRYDVNDFVPIHPPTTID